MQLGRRTVNDIQRHDRVPTLSNPNNMKLDEFAFLNQQLAGMLRAGIPLEGSLRELSATMKRGDLRSEMEKLEHDLSGGVPLSDAVSRRQLPDLYVRLVQAGVSGGDLPGVLILLADYYNRIASIATRLKGLSVYPFIVLVAAIGVSILITVVYHNLILSVFSEFDLSSITLRAFPFSGVWLPMLVLLSLAGAWLLVVFVPKLRNWARWRLPGFREASLAQTAGAAALLLRSGATLHGTLGLLQKAEQGSPAGREMARWLELHQQGVATWSSFTADSKVFPPLFRWLVAQGGDDVAPGFQRASEIYQARSTHKIDVLLYAALPMAVMFVAGVIVGQMYPVIKTIHTVLEQLGGL
jgi:type II secretory pathway component PulF